ncbi:MAG TPA: cytochrome P450 [Nocardioidaceae bacterium]|jgi:hypothetical protein
MQFATSLYRQRADVLYHGYVRRDPMCLLQLAPGRRDPYAIYEQMRAVAPIQPTRLGNWVTTSHVICRDVLRDRRLGVRPESVDPADEDFDLSFLDRNPPDHTRLRRLAAPAFSPKHMAAYRPRIEKTVHALIDDMERQAAGGHSVDLVAAFAAPLPITVITDLLGIPDARATEFARYGATIGSALDGIKSMRHASALMAANRELEKLFGDLFALRRREPTDDVVSSLVAAEGDQISSDELLPLCVLLLIAGFETTVNLIGNAVLGLLDHPHQWSLLREDRGLAPQAVEETLRFDPPVQRTARVALHDMELAGVTVRKDQFMVTLIGAANRDPEVYDRPAEYDITRQPSVEHLAFSAGIHYCLGQPLARLEAEVAFAAIAERLPRLALAGPVRRRNATTIRGPLTLPVNVS